MLARFLLTLAAMCALTVCWAGTLQPFSMPAIFQNVIGSMASAVHPVTLRTCHASHVTDSNSNVTYWYVIAMPSKSRRPRTRRVSKVSRRRATPHHRRTYRKGGKLPWLKSKPQKPLIRKVLSQADLDHLLISPDAAIRPHMRQVSPQDAEDPKDIDQIYLAPPAKVSGS